MMVMFALIPYYALNNIKLFCTSNYNRNMAWYVLGKYHSGQGRGHSWGSNLSNFRVKYMYMAVIVSTLEHIRVFNYPAYHKNMM